MNETISAFPSQALYSNALINHTSVAHHRLIDLPTIIDRESEDAQDTLTPTLVFFDTAGSEMYERLEADGEDAKTGGNKRGGGSVTDGSRFNENEAEIVAQWTRKLVSVTPYLHSDSGAFLLIQTHDTYTDCSGRPTGRYRHHHALPSPSIPLVHHAQGNLSRCSHWFSRWNARAGKRSRDSKSRPE